MLLLDRKHLHFAVNRICQFYKTTVLGLHLGPYPVVIVNDSENVKKVLYHRDFDGRPDILMGRMRHPNLDLHGELCLKFCANLLKLKSGEMDINFKFSCKIGIFFTDSAIWHEQRRFALRYLRDFGFGRRFDALEKEIEIQIAQCIDIVKNGPKYRWERVSVTEIPL